MLRVTIATSIIAISAGASLAADNGSISLTSTVLQACSVTVSNLVVDVPANGDESPESPFTFTCNYAGQTASLTYDSQNNGVKRVTGGPVRVYQIITNLGADGDSSAPLTTPGLSTTELTPVTNGVRFKLSNPDVAVGAGAYLDTLLITISP